MAIIEITPIKGSTLSPLVAVPPSLRVMEDGEKPRPGCGIFRVINKDGDKRVVWDSHDLLQIEEARDMFNELVQQGLVPYKVGLDGRATAEVMDEFDPTAEEVIFLPVAAAVTGG